MVVLPGLSGTGGQRRKESLAPDPGWVIGISLIQASRQERVGM